MKLLIILVWASCTYSFPLQDIRQPREIIQRRQMMSYSSNVIHQNPNNPDQMAESTVKVNFNPNQLDQNTNYQYYGGSRDNRKLQASSQNYPINAASGQSQLFNVGYSVSFTNNQATPEVAAPQPHKHTRGSLDDGEIITGTRKLNEEVQVPKFDVQDFVTNALLEKKQKISGIKPKIKSLQGTRLSYPNAKTLLSQANLSPQTQKYYMALEKLKIPVKTEPEINQKYTWQQLSPSVEIIRSTEIPTDQEYTKAEPQAFDHVRALGRSQEFDYTNAVEVNQQQQQIQVRPHFQNIVGQRQADLPPITRQLPASSSQDIHIMVPTPHTQPLVFPVDTSLLKAQPVLTTDIRSIPNDPSIIPIRIDTRFLQEAMKNELGVYSTNNQNVQDSVPESSQDNYLQQLYRTIPPEHIQNIPPEGMKSFQDYPRYKYKIYGKPQPVKTAQGFNQQDEARRQPRYVTDLQTDLRPPPLGPAIFQRRIHRNG